MRRERAPSKAKTKRTRGASALALLFAILATPIATAQQLPLSPPMPPPRPAMPDEQPAAREAPAPATRGGGETPQKEEAQPATPPADEAPHIAPDVDRAALRECALEWHRMTMTGAALGLVWRDFAPECLARKSTDGR